MQPLAHFVENCPPLHKAADGQFVLLQTGDDTHILGSHTQDKVSFKLVQLPKSGLLEDPAR